jgi:hypothetical protein
MPTGLAVLLTAAPPSINGWPNDRAKRRERFIRDYLADDQPNFVTAAKFERIARTVSRYALRRGLRHAGASPHPYRRSHRWSHFPSKAAAKDQAEKWERGQQRVPAPFRVAGRLLAPIESGCYSVRSTTAAPAAQQFLGNL